MKRSSQTPTSIGLIGEMNRSGADSSWSWRTAQPLMNFCDYGPHIKQTPINLSCAASTSGVTFLADLGPCAFGVCRTDCAIPACLKTGDLRSKTEERRFRLRLNS